MSFRKRVDKSLLRYGTCIPDKYAKEFETPPPIKPGERRDLLLIIEDRVYDIEFRYIKRKGGKPIYQLRWDSNKELLERLRSIFKHSYKLILAQERFYKSQGKYHITKLHEDDLEYIVFIPIGHNYIATEIEKYNFEGPKNLDISGVH